MLIVNHHHHDEDRNSYKQLEVLLGGELAQLCVIAQSVAQPLGQVEQHQSLSIVTHSMRSSKAECSLATQHATASDATS